MFKAAHNTYEGLNLSTADILGHVTTAAVAVLCTAGNTSHSIPASTHYRRQQQSPSSSCDNQKYLQIIAKCPLRGKVTTHSSQPEKELTLDSALSK